MLLKFKRDWKRMRAGQVYDWAEGAALILVRRGIAEAIKPVQPETAMRGPGRPRKTAIELR